MKTINRPSIHCQLILFTWFLHWYIVNLVVLYRKIYYQYIGGSGSKNLTLAAFRVILIEIPEAILASIATSTFDIGLAVATARHQVTCFIRVGITYAIIQRTTRITIACWKQNFYFIHKFVQRIISIESI